jgi:hypothetical protein
MSLDWTYRDADVAVFTLPILREDQEFEMSVYVQSPSLIQNAFLYTESGYTGIITAKRFTSVIYQTVGVYSSQPNCFLGSIDANVQTGLNVKLDFSESSLYGEQVVPLWLAGGENIEQTQSQYTDPFWKDFIDDPPSLWAQSPEYVSLWSWIDTV